MRNPPVRHTVKSHIRDGEVVKEYQRGKGARPPKRPRRMVGLNIKKLPTFKTLKRRGRFSVPEEEIDPGVREIWRRINKLPYAVTVGSCEGHTREELLERGWTPTEIEVLFPLGYSPARVDMYVLADSRFELWNWLKENIGLDKVDIHQTPMEGGEGYSWFVYREEIPTYVRDKLFHVGVESKSLRMPFKVKRQVFVRKRLGRRK